jgi:DAPkinase-like Roc (Ras of Complex) protein
VVRVQAPRTIHKVMLLGDESVNKTAFIAPFSDHPSGDLEAYYLGIRISLRVVTREWQTSRGPVVAESKWILWHMSGLAGWAKVHTAYGRNASGAVILCLADAADPAQSLARWASRARIEAADLPLLVIMIGQPTGPSAAVAESAAAQFNAAMVYSNATWPEVTERALVAFGERLVDRYLSTHPGWPEESQGIELPPPPKRARRIRFRRAPNAPSRR